LTSDGTDPQSTVGGGSNSGQPPVSGSGTTPSSTKPGSSAVASTKPPVLVVNGANPTFSCEATARPSEASLRRLTMLQYQNTVKDLTSWATGANSQVGDAVTAALGNLPVDRREKILADIHGTYRRLDQSLQQGHVDALYSVATNVGRLLTGSDILGRVVGECATDGNADNDASCLDDFIHRFGSRALRRPVTDEELGFYRSVYGTSTTADPAAYSDVIAVLLNAPDFVYFVEHGDREVAGQAGVYEVSAVELASRLSYQLWQTAPDAALAQAAADGSLLEASVLDAQVDRLLADPRARVTLDEFVEDWLKVEDLPPLDAHLTDPVFSAFAGDVAPDRELHAAMTEDVLGMVGYYTWTKPSGLKDLLLSNSNFARSSKLAGIYGAPVWDGESTPPTFPEGERPGLLTRALFLSTGTATTRPIMKGVFIRKHMLCDDIPAPPAGANVNVPELAPDLTTREVIEKITEIPGTNCAGCHVQVINPLGFATEGFDSLGRIRTAQTLYGDDGSVVGSRPIDGSVVPQVVLGDKTAATGANDLMQQIAKSGKAEACFARNYFRFTFARWEDTAVDGCALEAIRSRLDSGGHLADAFKAVILTPAFRRRAFE